MRWMFLCILLIASMLFFTACNKENEFNDYQESIAVIDFEKAFKAHHLYSAMELAKENELTTQKLKDNYLKMVKDQTQMINKMEQLGQDGRMSYFQADFAIKMSEASINEKEKLLDLKREEKKRIDDLIKEKIDAIEEEYQLPLFNLKTQIEAANPLVYSQDEGKAQKEELVKAFEKMQQEKAQKINQLYLQRDALVDEAMLVYEQEANQRLQEYSKQLFSEINSTNSDKQLAVQNRLESIPEAFAKTIASFDKQITEQKMLYEKLQENIASDIDSQVMKIAMQKKFTVVLRDVKININAIDITEEVIANLPEKSK